MASIGGGKLLSLLTFFAAAKKVSPAPDRGRANRPPRKQVPWKPERIKRCNPNPTQPNPKRQRHPNPKRQRPPLDHDKSPPHAKHHGFGPIGRAELAKDRRKVKLHRVIRDVELPCDLL